MNDQVRLNKNENLYGPSKACYEVFRRLVMEDLIYYDRKGLLKKKISDMLDLSEHQIVLGYGVEDILDQIFMNCIGLEDKVLISDKSWWYYDYLVQRRGGMIIKYPILEVGNQYKTDIQDILEFKEKTGSRLILICSPNNPTGHSISMEDFEILLKGSGDSLICLDETYWGYGQDTTPQLLKYLDQYDNFIVLRSFSKYYGLAGMRIGYGFFGKNIRKKLRLYESVLGFNHISEKVAIAALSSRDYYQKITQLIVKDRKLLYQELKALANIKVYDSKANFLLVQFRKELLKKVIHEFHSHNIVIKVLEEGGFMDCVRISIGRREHNEVLLRLIKSKVLDYAYSVKLA